MKLDSPEARAVVEADERLRPARGARPAHDQRHAPRLSPDVLAAAQSRRPIRRSSTCCASSGSRPSPRRCATSTAGTTTTTATSAAGGRGRAGGARRRAARAPARARWETFDHRPRFNNNYIGLRNRFALLSEAFAYLTFQDRILATNRFVEESLTFARANADRIRKATEAADRARLIGERLPLRAEMQNTGTVEVLMGEVVRGEAPGRRPHHGPAQGRQEAGDDGSTTCTFKGLEPERVPSAYFVPASLAEALDRLKAHGIVMTPLKSATKVAVEEFRIDSSNAAATAFQNHNERTLTGAWVAGRTRAAGRHAESRPDAAARPAGVLPDRAALRRRAGRLEPAGRGAEGRQGVSDCAGRGTDAAHFSRRLAGSSRPPA